VTSALVPLAWNGARVTVVLKVPPSVTVTGVFRDIVLPDSDRSAPAVTVLAAVSSALRVALAASRRSTSSALKTGWFA
jgi:hypothetical protein